MRRGRGGESGDEEVEERFAVGGCLGEDDAGAGPAGLGEVMGVKLCVVEGEGECREMRVKCE